MAESYGPVPPCKGCGSTNLIGYNRAEVSGEFREPLGVDEFGNLVFRRSYSGWGENERWWTECADCGRRSRKSLPPTEAPS